jgi:hypothetical protein
MSEPVVIEINDNCCICLESDLKEKIKLKCCRNDIHKSCLINLIKYKLNDRKIDDRDKEISLLVNCPLCRKNFLHKIESSDLKTRLSRSICNVLICLLILSIFSPFFYWSINAMVR